MLGIGLCFFVIGIQGLCENPEAHKSNRQIRTIRGWSLSIDQRLLTDGPDTVARAVELLDAQLLEITNNVPAPALTKLKQIPLYFSPPYPKLGPKAEYHPGAGWLMANGRDPAMAKGVEFTNVANFEQESKRMPNFTLHELAHGFHDRELKDGFRNVEIQKAYQKALASGSYEKVQHWLGTSYAKSPERAYAMRNPMEYFAENTEAFFSRNDFFPFTRDELIKHDPEMAALIARLWGVELAAR